MISRDPKGAVRQYSQLS